MKVRQAFDPVHQRSGGEGVFEKLKIRASLGSNSLAIYEEDRMDSIDDLMGQIPLDQLADRLGVDRATAEQATRKALPALLAGLQANAQDPAGAASLTQALGKHNNNLFGSGVDLSQVDTEDGDAIVGHVFGPNREQVVNKLGSTDAASQGLIGKLLPMLAPMVLSWLAGKFLGGNKAGTAAGGQPSAGGGLSDLLPGAGGQAQGGGGLGDLLGSVLGGSKTGGPGDGGSITDILGGLLGGGRR